MSPKYKSGAKSQKYKTCKEDLIVMTQLVGFEKSLRGGGTIMNMDYVADLLADAVKLIVSLQTKDERDRSHDWYR